MKQIEKARQAFITATILVCSTLAVAIPTSAFVFFWFSVANNSTNALTWVFEFRALLALSCFVSLLAGIIVTGNTYSTEEVN